MSYQDKVIKVSLKNIKKAGLPLTPDDVKMSKGDEKRFKSLKKALSAVGGSLTVETAFPLYAEDMGNPETIKISICKTTFKLTKKGNVKIATEIKGKKLKMSRKASPVIYAHIMKWTEYFRTTDFKDDFKLLTLKNPGDFWASFPKDPNALPKDLADAAKELASRQIQIGDSLKLAVEIKNDQVVVVTMIVVDFNPDENRVEVFCPTEGRIIVMTSDEFMHAKALHTHCVVKKVIEPDNVQEQMIKTIFDKIIPDLKKNLGDESGFGLDEKDAAVSVFVKGVMSEIVPEIKKMIDGGKGTFKISKKGKIKNTGVEIESALLAKICSAMQTAYKYSDDFVGLMAKKHKIDEGIEVLLCAKILDVDLDKSTGTMVGSIETLKRGVEKFRLSPEEFALAVIRFVEMELLTGKSDNPEFIVKKKAKSKAKAKKQSTSNTDVSDEISEIVEDIFDGLKDLFND